MERGEIPPAHFSLASICHYFLRCFEHSLVKKKIFFFEEKNENCIWDPEFRKLMRPWEVIKRDILPSREGRREHTAQSLCRDQHIAV